MATLKRHVRLYAKMKNILIGADLDGIAQSKLIAKCRTYHPQRNPNGFTGEDIRQILTDWRQRGIVQRFEVTEGFAKKPTRIWRATSVIKEQRF